ncbi:hypothetical protein G4B88_017736 [Cannabis sativa]|uniref:Inositol-3-phosphate synthase n=1 Tax=Cannabis sativa TaxID=3483 RepID=A0A7J6I3Q8_CANSA|nr:hypothetical protein G4B88_017736 [Cannabis sativa]
MNLASFKVKESYNMRGQAEDVSLTTGQSENHPKMVMLVGWGGNNGSTLTGGVIANRDILHFATVYGTEGPSLASTSYLFKSAMNRSICWSVDMTFGGRNPLRLITNQNNKLFHTGYTEQSKVKV